MNDTRVQDGVHRHPTAAVFIVHDDFVLGFETFNFFTIILRPSARTTGE